MKKGKQYDGMMVYPEPIVIVDKPDDKQHLSIYGLLYSTTERENNPVWILRLELYSCYLKGLERLCSEGGKLIDRYTWMTSDGKVHPNIDSTKIQMEIYSKMRPELQYKLYEFSHPLQYTDDEVQGGVILNPSIFDRCGVSFIESVNIQNNKIEIYNEEDVRPNTK